MSTNSLWTRRINVAALTVAVGLALIDIVGGVKAFSSPRGSLNGVPFPMLFFLATVMIMAATGDGSFFSIRARVAKVLPEPFTTAPMRVLPILLVFGAMFYWLWRVRGRRTLPVHVPRRFDATHHSRGVNCHIALSSFH